MDLLFSDPRAMASLLGVFVSGATAIFAYVANRSKAKAQELEKLELRITEQDKLILTLQNQMQHLPDKDLVTDIRLALAKLEGTVGQFGEKLNGVAHLVGVIDETLRGDGKK
jgi:uncharacterized protein DUF2730